MIDTIPVGEGDRLRLSFESADDRWPHGVWLAVDGTIVIGDTASPQVTLWRDASPRVVDLIVEASRDGLLRLYNVWDSGRGKGRESQSHTSGMRREPLPGGWRYRCNDIGLNPDYTALVFTVTRP
jgi:hypothetical protein